MHAWPPAPCWHGGSGGTGDTGKLLQLLSKGNSQTSHVPGAGDRGLLYLGQLPVVGKEIWGAAGGGWRQVGTGARSCLCDAACKEGRLLGGSGLLPKVVQPSEKWDSPPFLPSPLQGEEPLLLPETMLLPLLHTHARERCVHSSSGGELFPPATILLPGNKPKLEQLRLHPIIAT